MNSNKKMDVLEKKGEEKKTGRGKNGEERKWKRRKDKDLKIDYECTEGERNHRREEFGRKGTILKKPEQEKHKTEVAEKKEENREVREQDIRCQYLRREKKQ